MSERATPARYASCAPWSRPPKSSNSTGVAPSSAIIDASNRRSVASSVITLEMNTAWVCAQARSSSSVSRRADDIRSTTGVGCAPVVYMDKPSPISIGPQPS
jgi:hypothetical protein